MPAAHVVAIDGNRIGVAGRVSEATRVKEVLRKCDTLPAELAVSVGLAGMEAHHVIWHAFVAVGAEQPGFTAVFVCLAGWPPLPVAQLRARIDEFGILWTAFHAVGLDAFVEFFKIFVVVAVSH